MKDTPKEHEFARGFLIASLIFVFLGVIGFLIYSVVSRSRSFPKAFSDNQSITVQYNSNNRERGTFIDERDGHIYKWVMIGDQVWMTENLSYLPSVSPSSEGSGTVPYYYVYSYEGTSVSEAKATANYSTYGVLYNWPAAMKACPSGWHLPMGNEWDELINRLGNEVAGGKMKALNFWTDPNTGATDESGFSALPGGFRNPDNNSDFNELDTNGIWWSSRERGEGNANAYELFYKSSYTSIDMPSKGHGYSARCVKGYLTEIHQKKSQELFADQSINFNYKLEPNGEVEYDNYLQDSLNIYEIYLYNFNTLIKSINLGIAYDVYICMSADSSKLFFINSNNGSIPHNYPLYKYDFNKDKLTQIRYAWSIAGYFNSSRYKNNLLIGEMTFDFIGPEIFYYLIDENGTEFLRIGNKSDLNEFLSNNSVGFVQVNVSALL